MPTRIEPVSNIRVAERKWRRGGDAFVTVIAKATFAYAPGTPCVLVSPEALSIDVDEDRVREPLLKRAARTARATELAPVLPQGGVVVLGFACAPEGTMTRELMLRLAVRQKGLLVIDKQLHVLGDRNSPDAFPDPFDALPLADELCFGGPRSPENPRGVGAEEDSALPNVLPPDREGRFTNVGPLPTSRSAPVFASLGQPFVEVSGDAEWDAYQTTPEDQRLRGPLSFWSGDETIVLEGFDRASPRVEITLPGVTAHGRWARGAHGVRNLELVADCITIDTEARQFSMTWRGHVPDAVGDDVHVAVALGFGTTAIAWPQALRSLAVTGPHPSIASSRAPALPPAAALGAIGRTLPMPPRIVDHETPLDMTAFDATHDSSGGGETVELMFGAGSGLPEWIAKADAKAAAADKPSEAAALPIPGAPWSPVAAKSTSAPVWSEETHVPGDDPRLRDLPQKSAARASPPAIVGLPASTPAPAPPPSSSVVPPPRLVAAPAVMAAAPAWQPTAVVPQTVGMMHVARELAARAANDGTATPTSLTPSSIAPLPPARLDSLSKSGERAKAPDAPAPEPAKPASLKPSSEAAPSARPTRVARESPQRTECLSRIEKGQSLEGIDLTGCDLAGTDFKERSLARANLSGARLDGAILAKCNLTGAILEDADLSEADLGAAVLTRADASRANMKGANLERTQLVDTILDGARAQKASFKSATGMRVCFVGADLSDANFASASIDRADLTGATIDRADFTGASFLRGRFDEVSALGVCFEGARMSETRFERAKLDAAECRGMIAQHAVFTGAHAHAATLTKADLRGASLRGASLTRAVLSEADLRDADLREAELAGASLARANLEAALLGRAVGVGVSFESARLAGADLRDANFEEAAFKEAACVRARFERARLYKSDFTRADLRHSGFRDGRLAKVDLSQALVDGADLRGAELDGAVLYKVDLSRARTSPKPR